MFSSGKQYATGGFTRIAFFDISGRAVYDSSYVGNANTMWPIPSGSDIIIGKDYVIQDDVILGNSDNGRVIIGDNASGKTSLLESIYYLSHLRSFRSKNINDIIQHHFQDRMSIGAPLRGSRCSARDVFTCSDTTCTFRPSTPCRW